MNIWRRSPAYNARLALAGAVAGACAAMASPAPGLADDFMCTADAIAVLPGSRIHVHCNPGSGSVSYFALSTANADVNRILSLASTAVVASRPLRIYYTPNDLSGAAIGCANVNCRLLWGMELQ